MAENQKSSGMRILIIIAVIVIILVIAYAIYHYSGVMKMFNPNILSYAKELIK